MGGVNSNCSQQKSTCPFNVCGYAIETLMGADRVDRIFHIAVVVKCCDIVAHPVLIQVVSDRSS